jgi:hypothetical protein
MDYKIGDKTPDGWEITSVYHKPIYTFRKRIKITNNHKNYNGMLGYYYLDSRFKWVELDDGSRIKLLESEFEYID